MPVSASFPGVGNESNKYNSVYSHRSHIPSLFNSITLKFNDMSREEYNSTKLIRLNCINYRSKWRPEGVNTFHIT